MKAKLNEMLSEHLQRSESEDVLDRSKEEIKRSFLDKLFYGLGRIPAIATEQDYYKALALTVRDWVFRQYVRSLEEFAQEDARGVAYLSAEYLPGPHLGNNLINLNILEPTRQAMKELSLSLDELLEQEVEPGLGNGGLGRLASCYLQSMATLGIPSIGYGLRYEFGIFRQSIQEGWQSETTDKWLHYGNPWEVIRPEIAFTVQFGGRTVHRRDQSGKLQVEWLPGTEIRGVAYDTPILGYQSNGIIMRLWSAEAVESFDFSIYNTGDYYKAVEEKMHSENITKVLYPNDENLSGKELRLKQQYFLVTCSLQDMIRLHLLQGRNLRNFHEKFTIQLNDTHPSMAVPELMRLLVDIHGCEWEEAWDITKDTFAYTNHTLLPEALEKWSVKLLEDLLPRHLEIIYEINRRHIEELREQQISEEKIQKLSLIDEHGGPAVRMAHLATLGSYKVNGVSALHSKLLQKEVLNNFADIWPEKFTNVTNGIDPRRFLAQSNPGLSRLISERVGQKWLNDLTQLEQLEPLADDKNFQARWSEIKLENKKQLSKYVQENTGIWLDPHKLFDIHVKRIHEYKRQHLKVLHILHLYFQIKNGNADSVVPTAFIFGGKAAPGYSMAKRIIKLINSVADLVNEDEQVSKVLQVVFLPNFSVKQAQRIYPAADLSEQISTAGKEASGTGNMKFALNGALTVGTLDGANVEIREAVGETNFFLFGQNTEEVQATRQAGYKPQEIYSADPELQAVLNILISGRLDPDKELFRSIFDNLLYHDPFQVLKDFRTYIQCQQEVHEVWKDQQTWTHKSILNTARMGKFSADRAISEYCNSIWKVHPVKI